MYRRNGVGLIKTHFIHIYKYQMMENTQKIRYKTGLQSKKGDNIITVLETLRIKK